MRDRIELVCWTFLFALCLTCLGLLVSGGCKGPDAGARVLSTFEVAYTDGSGSTSSAFGGSYQMPYQQDPAFEGTGSADTDFHAWTFSIQPLAGLYDPQARTRESVDALYAAMMDREAAARAEREAAKAAELPFVEKSPEEPVEDLPWWKNAALLTGYATLAAAVIAGLVKGWALVKSAKKD